MGWSDIRDSITKPYELIREGLGSLTGQNETERAIERGAGAMQQATTAAVAEQQAAREQISRELAPYREFGAGVLPLIGGTIGQVGPLPSVLPGDIGQDTLFQALKREAITGIESSAAARGKLFSGTTPQAIAQSVQDLAMARASDIQRQNILARQQMLGEQQQQFGQLFNVAQLGQASAAQQAANIQTAAGNIGGLLGQQADAFAAGQMAQAQMRGQMFGNLLQLGGTLGGAYMLASDRRIKEDIKRIGKTDDGLPIYTFRYKGYPTVHMGVMAQDVEKKNPDAVKEIDGIKAVNYGAL